MTQWHPRPQALSYDGKPWMYSVNLLEFGGDKVEQERIYIMDGWDAPSGAPPGGRRPQQIRHHHPRSSAAVEPRPAKGSSRTLEDDPRDIPGHRRSWPDR